MCGARPAARAPVVRHLLALALVLLGCREQDAELDDARPDSDGYPYPPPRTDVFPAIGSADTLEIATWNIENFPLMSISPARTADLITSLDLDVIVVEEIASDTAWRELLDRLREHDGVLSDHRYSPTEYQKIGVIYRATMVIPGPIRLLFPTESFVFPRPPVSVELAIDDGVHRTLALEVIGLHLKAGGTTEDGERRRAAIEQLDAHIRAQVDGGGEDEIVIAGDFNEVLTTVQGQTNFAAFLGAPDRYTIRTQAAAEAGQITFVPSQRFIDHIATTAGLEDELGGSTIVIPRLHTLPGYVPEVSDHLPVVLVVPQLAR